MQGGVHGISDCKVYSENFSYAVSYLNRKD